MSDTNITWPSVTPLTRNTVADGKAIQKATIKPLEDRTDLIRDTINAVKLKYGIFYNDTDNYKPYGTGGWTFARTTGNLEISQDGTAVTGLNPNKIYHVVCTGHYKVLTQQGYILNAYIQDNDIMNHDFDVDLSNSVNREIPVTFAFDYIAQNNDTPTFMFTKWGSEEQGDVSFDVSFSIESLSLTEVFAGIPDIV